MPSFSDSLAAMALATASLPSESAPFTALTDTQLLEAQRNLSAWRHAIEASEAMAAGEIARRSHRDLGYAGLAQRTGFHSAERLVQHVTGATHRQASELVRVGVVIHDAEEQSRLHAAGTRIPTQARPWLEAVGRAVACSSLSVAAADAIRMGLGEPATEGSEGVTATELTTAAKQLVNEAAEHNVDELLVRARALRDTLDAAGIADRERDRHHRRSLRRFRRSDGMTAYSLLCDPENAAYLDAVYDQLTSPRRGGPRFVDPADRARADAINNDPRTTEQLAFDGLMAVLRIGVDTDAQAASRSVLGSRRPAVRVLVTQLALATRAGHGRLEGQDEPISIETVERHACESGIIPIAFDDAGQCVNVGREHRLFTARQRVGLAARDGGCRWPSCTRPASWTEAHHIDQWHRDEGKTDVADGILLCRHHHMLLHNNHWKISRSGSLYWLVPPRSEDAARTPRPMPHKSAALDDLARNRGLRSSA